MTDYSQMFQSSNLGYAAIFFCLFVGFFFLRSADRDEAALTYWAVSFGLNSLGFLFWSNVFSIPDWQMLLAGEIFHVLGFTFLFLGICIFYSGKIRPPALAFILPWLAIWLFFLATLMRHPGISLFMIRFIRSGIFGVSGAIILLHSTGKGLFGNKLAGVAMLVWGVYVFISAIHPLVSSPNLQYGILSGFHILAACGLVAIVVDRVRLRAEKSEATVKQLEGLLPICGFCKKIRDDHNEWHSVEKYISERTETEFSHGVCPECYKKHYGDL